MAAHSSIVGGSTAGRVLECPGSFQATQALPPSADKPSEYAEEGTFAHTVMAHLMQARSDGVVQDPHDYIGIEFYDRELTRRHVDEMIQPALNDLRVLEEHYGGGFTVLAVEHRIRFSAIKGSFGTVDLILGNATHVLHVDWKFGAGVGVRAIYPDPERGDLINPQLMYYVAGATSKRLNKVNLRERIQVGAIIQPRSAEPLTYTEITRDDIRNFVQDLKAAVATALSPDPPRVRGEWCRFAPCKISCPLWTGPLLDLSALTTTASKPPAGTVVTASPVATVTPYGAYLAKAKALVDSLAMMKAEVDGQLHAFLESGGFVPGWRLKAKARPRQWIEERKVATALADLGFADDEIWQKKLVTFQSADATAKQLGVSIPDVLRPLPPPSGETTIATTDDPAPLVDRSAIVREFGAALRQLETGNSKGNIR
jgi:hypothetical protein